MKSNSLSLFLVVGLVSVGNLSLARGPVTLKTGTDSISSLTFSPDSKTLASSTHDGTVRFSDAISGKEIAVIKLGALVHAVAFSPDGKLLAVALVGTEVAIWEVATRKRVRRLGGHKNYVRDVVFSRDGKTLASSDGEGTIRLWNTRKWTVDKTLANPPRVFVRNFDLSQDGKWLAASTDDAIARVWNLQSGKVHFTIKPNDRGKRRSFVGCVAFSPDSKSLATTSTFIIGGVRVYDLDNPGKPREHYQIPWNGAGWSDVCFTSDGKEVACASGYWHVLLWKPGQRYPQSTMYGDGQDFVDHIAVSRDGKKLAYSVASREKNKKRSHVIRLWDIVSFRKAARKLHP